MSLSTTSQFSVGYFVQNSITLDRNKMSYLSLVFFVQLTFMLNEPQDKPLIKQKGKDLWLRQPCAS